MGLAIASPESAKGDLGFAPKDKIKHLERLPYYGLDGGPIIDPKLGIPFARYRIERPDDWRPTPKGTKDAHGNPIRDRKYISPLASSTFVYLPRVEGLNWGDVSVNPSVEVFITEGEFKSYTLTKSGYACVGLSGIQAFGKNDAPFPEPFAQFSHLDRLYYIVFDADSESDFDNPLKPTVRDAALRLASKLTVKGGRVYLLNIARTDTFKRAREKDADAKMGVDDYLHANGTIEELLATRTDAVQCQDMATLRNTYAYYSGEGPHIVNVTNGNIYKTGVFVNELERHRIRYSEGKGGLKKTYVAQEFLELRDKPVIERKVFWPSHAPGYDAENRLYNEWRGFAVDGRVPEGEDGGERYNEVVAVWRRFLGGLFGLAEEATYAEKWIADIFQYPGRKTTKAVLLMTPLTGIGKSLLGEIIRALIGETHSVAVELDRTMDKFNALLSRKLFVQIDEAQGRFSGHESKLDDLVTSDKVVIEKKGFDPITVDNFGRIFMTSNSSVPIRLNAENRRMFVSGPTMLLKDKPEWSAWVGGTAAKVLKSAEGLAALRWHLDRVDLTGWNPTEHVMVTGRMMDLVEMSGTVNTDVAAGLMETFLESGDAFWFLTSSLRERNKVAWGELSVALKLRGGRSLRHEIKIKGQKIKGAILDLNGTMPYKQDKDQKYVLDNLRAELTGEQVLLAQKRAEAVFDQWSGIVAGSKKY